MTEKTSAYVFPFKPFSALEQVEETANILAGKTVDIGYFQPLLDVVAPLVEVPEGDSLPEQLLHFFADRRVCFGEPEWILQLAERWTSEFAYFIDRNEPILFTILGFPFKAPVPLKTNRTLPDFGEVAMLARLHQLGVAISKVYAPGIDIHIFAEGAFSQMNGMPREIADAYFVALQETAKTFGYDQYITLHDTSRIVDEVEGFEALWDEVAHDIKARRDAGDATTVDALTAAYPVTFHLNTVVDQPEEQIRLAYLNLPEGQDLRRTLDARSEDGVIRYRAFLEARDRISLLERYTPKGVALTVSPRPGRIGVRPLPLPADVLPYHGVPVWNAAEQTLSIIYLWDLKRSGLTLEPIYLQGDAEDTPFLYVI